MNTIYYVNVKTGEQRTVKVGQGGIDWLEQNGQRDLRGRLPRRHTPRRRTVAEADTKMLASGFVRRNGRARTSGGRS